MTEIFILITILYVPILLLIRTIRKCQLSAISAGVGEREDDIYHKLFKEYCEKEEIHNRNFIPNEHHLHFHNHVKPHSKS